MQHEMHSFDVGHLKSINILPPVLFRPHQLSQLRNSQEAPQPIPFVIVSHEESGIAICDLVTRSSKHNLTKRQPHSLSKLGQVDCIARLIARLLSTELLELGRKWDIDRLAIPQTMYLLLQHTLRQQRRVNRIVWLALCLTHIITERSTGTTLQESRHGATEEAIGVAHRKQFAVTALRKDAKVDSGHVLVAGIRDRGAVLHEFQDVELFEHFFAEFVAHLVFGPFALFFNVEAAEVDVVFCLVASEGSDSDVISKVGEESIDDLRDFCGWWRRKTFDS